MRSRLLAVVALAVSMCAADAMRKAPKPPDLEVLAASARHNEDRISLDGRVRNTGEKAISSLTLAFDFLDSDGTLLTTQKNAIDEELLEPGKEAVFRFEVDAPPRAIKVRINAFDGNERELRVAKAGPFVID
ncbi:MAG TPA: FxLYD domain-containing protein [Bryobacteraceae bacterium]|nr:FxLYD domain-containing protein [Bryobacteraceae bacterium]